jgi:hypothetical protein
MLNPNHYCCPPLINTLTLSGDQEDKHYKYIYMHAYSGKNSVPKSYYRHNGIKYSHTALLSIIKLKLARSGIPTKYKLKVVNQCLNEF